jgi:hypothetical protein
MPSYSPELIQIMRAALDEVMTKIPLDQATPGIKAHMAEFILRRPQMAKPVTMDCWRRRRTTFKQFFWC